jgi:non-lysosomal glucosylceramidase
MVGSVAVALAWAALAPDVGAGGMSPEQLERIGASLRQGSDGRTPTLKNFDDAWIASLDQRGEPTVHTRANSKDFEHIGMPIGGIGAGLLYLGGDGKLWGWDLFNTKGSGHARQEHGYRSPYTRSNTTDHAYYPLVQGFAVRIEGEDQPTVFTLDRDGFKDIRFRGEYPIGRVAYADPNCPVQVELEAFSPFCPLDLDSSTYPATVLTYTVKNTGDRTVSGELLGWLQNAVLIDSGREKPTLLRHNRVLRTPGAVTLEFTARAPRPGDAAPAREEIVFDDFEKEIYDGWEVTGTAFGAGPVAREQLPHYLANANVKGRRMVSSHNTRQGEDPGAADAHQGAMVSREFTIERKLIAFLIGGGEHPGRTGMRLLVDGQEARSATGKNSNELRLETFDVSDLQGRKARLEIFDALGGHWANISVDHLVFCDELPDTTEDWMKGRVDYGSMALALVGDVGSAKAAAACEPPAGAWPEASVEASRPCGEPAPVGALSRPFSLNPGESVTARFVLAWYFPTYRGVGIRNTDRSYGERFASARAVAEDVVANLEKLTAQTRLWRDTWYDSTLPYWFLDRTFINTGILASNTSYIFTGGRFFGFEGEYLGYGTCTHVWGYVQAMGRLFPALERSLREMVDYDPKVGFDDRTGGIGQRGEQVRNPADDGQSGIILRTLLVHQMQPDNQFLAGIYPRMKQAMNFLVNQHDADKDGILTGSQMNTLDAEWFGKITWISLYYGAALRAAAEMAEVMDDSAAAAEWRAIADRGRAYIEEHLFNGEFFIHEADPEKPDSPGTYLGCHIDQLLGQSWAYQLGLGEVIDPAKAASALHSIWRYNFTTDVGPYREKFTGGRWYAMPGEGGLLMCSWPNGGSEVLRIGFPLFAGYLNECMTGFEYAASSLMMWHGMPHRSLAHTRIMNERYDATKRNPWSEVEWGSFYSRAMASYGVFTAACGFEYDGPRGHIGFAPRLTPDHFRAPFTAAEGWGTYEQSIQRTELRSRIMVRHGRLRLRTVALASAGAAPARVRVQAGGRRVAHRFEAKDGRILITLDAEAVLKAGQTLEIEAR